MSNNVRSWFITAIHESAQEMKQESKFPLFLGYSLFFIIYLFWFIFKLLPLFIILIIAFFIIAPVSIGVLFMAMG